MTHDPAEDYLSKSETEGWTWRVEDTWGDGDAAPAEEQPAAAEQPTEEGGEYLEADPLDTDWSRTWYDAGVGSPEGEEAPAAAKAAPERVPPAASPAAAPGTTAPLPSLSLTPLASAWDEEDEAVPTREPRLKRVWEEKGTKVLVPAGLALLLVLGVVLMVLNVMWAANA